MAGVHADRRHREAGGRRGAHPAADAPHVRRARDGHRGARARGAAPLEGFQVISFHCRGGGTSRGAGRLRMHQPVHWLRRVGSDLKTPGNLAECHEFQRYVPRLFACSAGAAVVAEVGVWRPAIEVLQHVLGSRGAAGRPAAGVSSRRYCVVPSVCPPKPCRRLRIGMGVGLSAACS
jgi:hypothetical protein